MGTRHERVVLEAQDNFSSVMAKAAVSTAVLRRELDSLSSHSVVSSRSQDRVAASIDRTAVSARRAAPQVQALGKGLGVLGDSLLLMGPAAIPIAASVIPALGGLANGLAMSALSVGATVMAFQGMGTALDALNAYSLEPTAENLAAVKEQMATLGPAAGLFAIKLREMQDAAEPIMQATRDGFFPGATDGLMDLQTMIPHVADLMGEVASVSGDMAAQTGEALSGDRAKEFVAFLESEARPAIQGMFDVTANLVGAASELWMAFDKTNGSWLDSAVAATERWDKAAQGLDESETFQDFLGWLDEKGPEVAETLGAVARMFGQIVLAVEPLSGPALDGIEFVANALAKIAETPLASRILMGVAALALLNRTLLMTSGALAAMGRVVSGNALSGLGGGGRAGQGGGMFGGLAAGAERARGGVRTLASDLRAMRAEYSQMGRTAAVTTSLLSGTTAAAQRTATTFGSVAKGAAVGGAAMGAMAALSTGAADEVGMTNTATLALVGTMAGPWGIAAGAAIGYMVDFAKAGGDLEGVLERVDGVLSSNSANFSSYGEGLATALSEAEKDFEVKAETRGEMLWRAFTPAGIKQGLDETFGGYETSMVGKAEAEIESITERMGHMATVGQTLAKSMGVVDGSIADGLITQEQMGAALQVTQPAMQALGYTLDDLVAASEKGTLSGILDEISVWQVQADSASGRTEAFAAAMADLDNDLVSTGAAAKAFSDALLTLLGPGLNLEAATDGWRQSLKDLRAELNASAGFDGNGDAAMGNREMTRQYVADSIERLEAMAAVTTTTQADMAKAVGKTREAFIESGVAAGFSREEIAARADEMGLTPDLVTTVFENAGIDQSEIEARNLQAAFRSLPKELRTYLKAEGAGALADTDALLGKYELTEKQRTALLSLRDQASGPLAGVLAKLLNIDSTNPTPEVRVTTSGAAEAEGILANVARPRTSVITVEQRVMPTNFVGPLQRGQVRQADGGTLDFYANGGVRENHVAQIAPAGAWRVWAEPETEGEAYIPFAASKRARSLDIWAEVGRRLGVEGFASGGIAGSSGPVAFRGGDVRIDGVWRDLERGIKILTRSVDKTEGTLGKARDGLDRIRDKMDEVGENSVDQLRPDLWAVPDGPSSPWVAQSTPTADPLGALRSSNADLVERRQLQSRLYKRGLRKGALAAALEGSNDDIESLLDNKQVAEFQRLYNRNAQLQTLTASEAGKYAYGKQERAQIAEVKDIKVDLRLLRKSQERTEKRDREWQKANKDVGKNAGKATSKTASRGRGKKR